MNKPVDTETRLFRLAIVLALAVFVTSVAHLKHARSQPVPLLLASSQEGKEYKPAPPMKWKEPDKAKPAPDKAKPPERWTLRKRWQWIKGKWRERPWHGKR